MVEPVAFRMLNGERVPMDPADHADRVAEHHVNRAIVELVDFPKGKLRARRNSLLFKSDWTQSPDSPLTDEAKATWATYREELRDLPESVEDPANPTWPEVPE